ncbi:MAG TPA: GNAT family N-acetyltransferase [Burkholderiaceae bacterium]|nr:GNAT family N-acetyltransferase [Burkholderiaceae bacterium]HMZ01351.1 GNAT family N-acetyltransferase [Burkholderiaceae bacterium]HNB45379.1 GNAT family N-acetyltransferase [Burkholderiaceae bacterium]HNG78570.1 GNAT family N-acetyltransferase [Burkholderiaceae bacterium]
MLPMPEVSDTLPPEPGEPPRVREARIRDWAKLVELARRVFPDLEEVWLSHWLRNERHSLVVAFTSAGLVGFARLEVQLGRRVTVLNCLGVDPGSRSQGVGAALLRYCENVAFACGAPRLEMSVPEDDPLARVFCQRFGYKTVQRPDVVAAPGWQTVTRRAPAPVLPMWDLRRLHAPRVPPAALERAATRVLFDAWLGRSLRQLPDVSATSGRPWHSINVRVAGGSAGA